MVQLLNGASVVQRVPAGAGSSRPWGTLQNIPQRRSISITLLKPGRNPEGCGKRLPGKCTDNNMLRLGGNNRHQTTRQTMTVKAAPALSWNLQP